MAEKTIFTRIIEGEIPSYKIYEDDKTFAFLDIHPIQPGHVLVVTKTPVENFFDLGEDDATAFWATIRKVAKHLKERFPAKKRIGLMIEGLDVAHVHAKLVPIDTGEEYRHSPNMQEEPDHAALAEMAQILTMETN